MELRKKLSSLVDDLDKSFWNGKGNIKFKGDLARFLVAGSKLKVTELREEFPTYVESGMGLSRSTGGITLGESRGDDRGFSVSFGGEIGFWLRVFLAKEGLDKLDDEDELRRVLEAHTALSEGALTVLDLTGKINGSLAGTPNFGSVRTSLTMGAGAAYRWSYCRPAADGSVVLDAAKELFSNARLPQTDLGKLAHAGKLLKMAENEVLFSQHLGFFNLGLTASWGYEFSRSGDYSIGAKDLSSKLTVAASAKLALGYSIAGAFVTVVRKGRDSNFLRVVVDKDRSSKFEFGLGVKVGLELETQGLPGSGLALVESIMGRSTAKVLKDTLAITRMSKSQLKNELDGFVNAVILKWVGKTFDVIDQEDIDKVLVKITNIRNQVANLDDRIVSVYERYVETPLEDVKSQINTVEDILERADELDGRDLIDAVVDPKHRQAVEELTGRTFSELFMAVEQKRKKILAEALKPIRKFRALIESGAETEIREFVNAKLKALNISSMMEKLAAYNSAEQLKAETAREIQELVGRLLDEGWQELVQEGALGDLFDEVRAFAADFEETLKRIQDLVEKALNAKGRFEISYAYQRAEESESLVDVEFDVSHESGRELFDYAVEGDWRKVLKDEYLPFIRINKAAFTDKLQTTKTLNVHVFGSSYRSLFSLLDQLESNVQVGPQGLMTVFNLRTEGKRRTDTEDRVTELTYLIEVAGKIRGAFADAELKKEKINALKTLRLNQNTFTYHIEDDLTDLEDLDLYLEVGGNLGILNTQQRQNLAESIQELREAAGYLTGEIGKAGLKYSVSYDGRTLADALVWDQQRMPVPVWQGSRRIKRVDSYKKALQHIFVDRLIASYASMVGGRAAIVVPTLYRNGLYETLVSESATTIKHSKILAHLPEQFRHEWSNVLGQDAARLHLVNIHFAKFLDRFRKAVNGSDKITLDEYRKFSRKLIKKLDSISKAHGVGPQAMPIMMLDEIVRRYLNRPNNTASPSTHSPAPATRTALLELCLYEPGNEEPVEWIPISG